MKRSGVAGIYPERLQMFLASWLLGNGLPDAASVNAGMCEEFAEALSAQLPGSEVVYTENYVDWGSAAYPGGHAWVCYEGRFYDSECLEGVSDWRSLPFFLRKASPDHDDVSPCF